MSNFTYTESNRRKIESFLLGIFTIYVLSLLNRAYNKEWHMYVSYGLLIVTMCNWIIYIGNVRSYLFRARFQACSLLGCVIVYAIHADAYIDTLPMFVVVIVLSGLFGEAGIVLYNLPVAIFIFIYHGILGYNIELENINEVMHMASQIGNIFILIAIMYLWTKRNKEGSSQLLKVIEELKAVQNSKDDFLANVSHEIRTPINTICGMSELVLREELSNRTREEVQGIQIAGRNLMSVVTDILDFSELQTGKMELEEEAYNITSTINDVINMTNAKKGEKPIEIIVDCDANIPCVLLGDEKKIRRVLLNLVDNAIKFTEQGCIAISIGCRREAYGINLVIGVKDTGIGMREESLERLFTSFNQVDSSRRRQEGGIGLGLAISRVLVQKMGGAITVKSKIDKGSTVQFVVPQKVLDERPIASIENRNEVNVATYIDMEQFNMVEIRDEYSAMIINMVERLRGKCHICRNFAELQRRAEKEHFSHIFTSIVEYRENKQYFDALSLKTKVVVVLDKYCEDEITNSSILRVYKPFYILTIVSVLNGNYDEMKSGELISTEKFVARDAHVLAVDDNRMNIRVLEGLLGHYNIKVTIATSGREALEKITSADYDFVFMDHMMPGMDGVETLHHIRRMSGSYYQKVPIIALTANAVAGAREMLLKEGFSDFVEKPIERSVLERVLKRNLDAGKIILKQEQVPQAQEPVTATVTEAVKESDKEMSYEEQLKAEGLDVNKGILYCSSMEQYIKILQDYCKDSDELYAELVRLFKGEDWKNYTIAIHGMKSAMRSIGAGELSDRAKELETAGRQDDAEYIRQNHASWVEDYKKLFEHLKEKQWLYVPEKEEKKEEVKEKVKEFDLPILESEAFDELLTEMDTAVFDLDEKRLLEIVTELERYQYEGATLKELLEPVRRKVEMSDYMSSADMVMRIKKELEHREVKNNA